MYDDELKECMHYTHVALPIYVATLLTCWGYWNENTIRINSIYEHYTLPCTARHLFQESSSQLGYREM